MANLDPFGKALKGYRLGVGDETAVRSAGRQARAQNYDFFNNTPLRNQLLQNKTDLSNTGLGYEKQLFPIGLSRAQNNLYAENLGNADEFLRRTGVYQPGADLMFRHYGLQPTYNNAGTLTFNQPTASGGLQALGSMTDPANNFYNYVNQERLLKAQAAQDAAQRAQAYWQYVMAGGAGGRGARSAATNPLPSFVTSQFDTPTAPITQAPTPQAGSQSMLPYFSGQQPTAPHPMMQAPGNPYSTPYATPYGSGDYNAILNGTFWR